MENIAYPDWKDSINPTNEDGSSNTISVRDLMQLSLQSHLGEYQLAHDIDQDISVLLNEQDSHIMGILDRYHNNGGQLIAAVDRSDEPEPERLRVKHVTLINAQHLHAMDEVCECENSENSEWSTTMQHQIHGQAHQLWNVLAELNANATIIARRAWASNPRELSRGDFKQFLKHIKGLDSTPTVANKDKWRSMNPYQNVSIRKATHIIIYVLENEDGLVRGSFIGRVYPVKSEPNASLDWQVMFGGYENELPGTGYGYYGPKLNHLSKEIIQPDRWMGTRNYKQCKSCNRVVHRNHTVFAVKHSNNGRFSICYTCASACTFGYSYEFNAFVMIHSSFIDNITNIQNYFREYTHRPSYNIYERQSGTSRNSSRYQWERIDWEDDEDLSLPIEVRKFMNWAWDKNYHFTPEANVYSSMQHVGVFATGDDFIAQDDLEGVATFDAFVTSDTDGFVIPGVHNGECDYDDDDCDVDHEYEDRTTWYAHNYSISDTEAEAARDGYHGNTLPYLFLKVYKASDWTEFLNETSRWGSRAPTNNHATRVIRSGLHIVRHGMNNIILGRQDHDYTFPIWQVGMVERLMGHFPDSLRQASPGMAYQINQRALKPLGQSTWSHTPQHGSSQVGTPEWHREYGPFYGMEIEMIGRRDLHNHDTNAMENVHRELVELFHPAWAEEQNQKVQMIYRVRDGSVDSGSPWGHELVSQAMSLNAWHQVPQDFWELMRTNYRAFYNADGERDRNNGIHIHIDHDAFTTAHLWAFLEIMYKFQDDVIVHENEWEENILGGIAQRPDGQWAHWRRPIQRSGRPEDATHLTAVRRRQDRADKYDGINLVKDGTIELRYFNSTTVPGRVLSRPEFVEAIYRFAWHTVVQHGMEDYHYNNGDDYQGSPVQQGLYNNSFKLYLQDSTYVEIVNDFWRWLLDTADRRDRYSNFIALAREGNLFELSDIYPSSSNMDVQVDSLVRSNEAYWNDRATNDTVEGE